jgi:tRNA(fMet)-specific endonuclease VapC
VDTSAYARLRAGAEAVIERLAAAESIVVPTIVLGELEVGFRLARRGAENRAALVRFLDQPLVAVVPVTADVARLYGELFAALRRAGTPVPVNDIWIAATALHAGAHLLTYDSDFERMPRVDCEVLVR